MHIREKMHQVIVGKFLMLSPQLLGGGIDVY